jgi:hypothetical protein
VSRIFNKSTLSASPVVTGIFIGFPVAIDGGTNGLDNGIGSIDIVVVVVDDTADDDADAAALVPLISLLSVLVSLLSEAIADDDDEDEDAGMDAAASGVIAGKYSVIRVITRLRICL